MYFQMNEDVVSIFTLHLLKHETIMCHPTKIMDKVLILYAHFISDGLLYVEAFVLLCYCQMELVSLTDKNYEPLLDLTPQKEPITR